MEIEPASSRYVALFYAFQTIADHALNLQFFLYCIIDGNYQTIKWVWCKFSFWLGASGQTTPETAVERSSKMKEQIEEQLKLLEEEITACMCVHEHTLCYTYTTSIIF